MLHDYYETKYYFLSVCRPLRKKMFAIPQLSPMLIFCVRTQTKTAEIKNCMENRRVWRVITDVREISTKWVSKRASEWVTIKKKSVFPQSLSKLRVNWWYCSFADRMHARLWPGQLFMHSLFQIYDRNYHSTNQWHIIFRNKCMSQSLNQFPTVTNVHSLYELLAVLIQNIRVAMATYCV